MRTLLQEVWLPGGLGTGACALQEDSDSSTDSGSETDSVDTQSETEVVALPLAA